MKIYLETEICALCLSWRIQVAGGCFLCLENSDVTGVVLEFEQLLYDVCRLLGRFFRTELPRCERFKRAWTSKLKDGDFCGQFWFLG